MTAYLKTYGCWTNYLNSEVISGFLKRVGCDVTSNEEMADVLILNSCIRGDVCGEIADKLKEWNKNHPDKKIILAGCMPCFEYKMASELVPEASLLGPNNCRDVPKTVKKTMDGSRVEFLGNRTEDKFRVPRVCKNSNVFICEINQGLPDCVHVNQDENKTPFVSYQPQDIIEEIKRNFKSGSKEIWISAGDTASYGKDIGTSLPKLLEKIVNISGKLRVRVGPLKVDTVRPILDDVLEIYGSEKIYSSVCMPLVSGSDKILRKMNMDYTSQEFIDVVKRFRERFPDLSLHTEIIVGNEFETPEDFEDTKRVLEEIKPDSTRISEPPEDSKSDDDAEIRSRIKKASQFTEKISLRNKKKIIGKEVEVLVTDNGPGKRLWIGRDPSYRKVLVKDSSCRVGQFKDVKIKKATKSALISN